MSDYRYIETTMNDFSAGDDLNVSAAPAAAPVGDGERRGNDLTRGKKEKVENISSSKRTAGSAMNQTDDGVVSSTRKMRKRRIIDDDDDEEDSNDHAGSDIALTSSLVKSEATVSVLLPEIVGKLDCFNTSEDGFDHNPTNRITTTTTTPTTTTTISRSTRSQSSSTAVQKHVSIQQNEDAKPTSSLTSKMLSKILSSPKVTTTTVTSASPKTSPIPKAEKDRLMKQQRASSSLSHVDAIPKKKVPRKNGGSESPMPQNLGTAIPKSSLLAQMEQPSVHSETPFESLKPFLKIERKTALPSKTTTPSPIPVSVVSSSTSLEAITVSATPSSANALMSPEETKELKLQKFLATQRVKAETTSKGDGQHTAYCSSEIPRFERVVMQDLVDLCSRCSQMSDFSLTRRTNTSSSPAPKVNLSGSFLDDDRYDFFDTNETGEIVLAPRPPIFPEEYPNGVQEHGLTWWGIQDLGGGKGKYLQGLSENRGGGGESENRGGGGERTVVLPSNQPCISSKTFGRIEGGQNHNESRVGRDRGPPNASEQKTGGSMGRGDRPRGSWAGENRGQRPDADPTLSSSEVKNGHFNPPSDRLRNQNRRS